MKLSIWLAGMALGARVVLGAPALNVWTPIFKGVDYATGTNTTSYFGGPQAVFALRLDLTDPDVRFFTTTALTNNYIAGVQETAAQKPLEFLEAYRARVVVNFAHFSPSPYNLASGTPVQVDGMMISQGKLVSPQAYTNDAISTMLFTSNKTVTFIPIHNAPGTSNTNGIYTAITGMYPLLTNGVNLYLANGQVVTSLITPGVEPHNPDNPRTAAGLSADRHYMYWVLIDGRQGGYSAGAADYETANWLLLCGASDGMNCDGGGSTALCLANPCGDGLELNHNSCQVSVGIPGFERSVGGNFGVLTKALPLTFVYDPAIIPGRTIASLSWASTAPASSQVEFGRTPSLGTFSTTDPILRTNHTVVLTNLTPGTSNYYRLISVAGFSSNTTPICSLVTSPYNPPIASATGTILTLFEVTNAWRYTSNNLDATAGGWTTNGYNDAGWNGPGPGAFYVEDNAGVPFRNTPLPTPCGVDGSPCLNGIPTTYYYRTHFLFPTNVTGATLIFSNYVDDGAIFYLNGAEVYRLHMAAAPTPIYNATLATGYSSSNTACSGDACVPELFALAGNIVSNNLRQGDNVLAVESHNYTPASYDAVFGGALLYTRSPQPTTNRLLVLSAEPAAGVPVAASPADAYGTSNNPTPTELYYVPGAVVTLTAPASAGPNPFLQWEVDGAIFSTNLVMTLNLSANRVVRAVYAPVAPVTLTVNATNPAGVFVSTTPPDLNGSLGLASTPFQRVFAAGTLVTNTAAPSTANTWFCKWLSNGLDFTTLPALSVRVDRNLTITAVFTNPAPAPPRLSLTQSGTNLVLGWTSPAFTLQYATNLTLPVFWTNVPGLATNSPYTNPLLGPRRFFQLKWP